MSVRCGQRDIVVNIMECNVIIIKVKGLTSCQNRVECNVIIIKVEGLTSCQTRVECNVIIIIKGLTSCQTRVKLPFGELGNAIARSEI